jgi:hypothetical protein
MSLEAEQAAFHVLNMDRKSIPGIDPFIEDLEREIDGVDTILITDHQPSPLEMQEFLTNRDAVLPEAFQTVSHPEPRSPLQSDEAIKYGLIHSGDPFLTQLGYAYAAASSRQRTLLAFAFESEVATAQLLGQSLWQQG